MDERLVTKRAIVAVSQKQPDDTPSTTQPETAAELERDITAVRQEMSDVAGELDRRRRRLVEVAKRVGRHAAPIGAGLFITLSAAGVVMLIARWRARHRQSRALMRWLPASKTSRAAYERLRKRVAGALRPAPPPRRPLRAAAIKIVGAGAASAASVAAKSLARRLMDQPSSTTSGSGVPAVRE